MTLMVNVPPPADNAAPQDEPSEAPEPQIVPQGTTATEGTDTKDLCACMACFCVICSIYPKFPQCLGCHSKGNVLCCEVEGVACKTGRTDGSICMCIKSELEIIKPTVCVKMTEQCFCLDARCAVPCDEDVPCMLSFAGCTLVKNYECACKAGASLNSDDGNAGAPPVADEMER